MSRKLRDRQLFREKNDIASYTPHRPIYVKQQGAALASFERWLVDEGIDAPLHRILSTPWTAAGLLRAFGIACYRKNEPLYNFLCVLTTAQREVLELRHDLARPQLP